MCVGALLYGCESCVITTDMETKINAFATSCYRIMLNIKRVDRIPNETIYNLTNTTPLVARVKIHQLKLLGHILRLEYGEPGNEYALYIPPHGKRKPGRPRTLYLQYVQHLLGDTEGMLQPNKIVSLAQDRISWRKLVVACSAAD